jgi:hypothetical protein
MSLSGRIPARPGTPNQSSCARGSACAPADLGKAGCLLAPPPAAMAGHPAQKGRKPEPLNQIPHQGLPAPAAWHDPLPDGRVKSACGAAKRALRAHLTCPSARRTRQLSGDRKHTQASPDQGDHDREPQKSNACGPDGCR